MGQQIKAIRSLGDDAYEVTVHTKDGSLESIVCRIVTSSLDEGVQLIETEPDLCSPDKLRSIDPTEFTAAVMAYHRSRT